MRRRCHRFFILSCLVGLAGPLHAELHDLLKPHALLAQVEAASEQGKEKAPAQAKEKPRGGAGSSASQGQP